LASRKKKPDDWSEYPFLTQLGIDIIKKYSPAKTHLGFGRFAAYKDYGEDIWRIGYGSTKLGKRWVGCHEKALTEQVDAQLIEDLKTFSSLAQHYIIVPLNEKKKAALLSFAHSLGIPSFKECKLLTLINASASKNAIIREWSPYINRLWASGGDLLIERRRVELNTYLAADKKISLFIEHKCPLKYCLLNIADNYKGTPNQIKAIEYLERKVQEWDPTEEVVRRFFRYWNQDQGGLGSPKNL
jgi:GH24 family phage-related lysozyme (muramidase)